MNQKLLVPVSFRMKKKITYLGILILVSNLAVSQSFKVSPLFLSDNYAEYAPCFYKDHFLIFCSNRKNDLIKTITDTTGKYLTDLYIINLSDTGNYKIRLFSKKLTTPFNEGPVCFNKDYSKIFFTRNLHLYTKPKDIEKKKNNLGIFYATATDTGWSYIEQFPFNNDNYNIAHPALNSTNDILVFSSDMPGGYGGSDLYLCRYINGEWTKPKNLGKKINSEYNEFFPFIHSSGRLYFASDRKNSKGGLDIYFCDKDNNSWTTPLPLDTPFNSSSDDFGIYIDSTFESGFFSSNRNGNDDIFHFLFQYPSFDNCDSMQFPVLCYELYEEHALNNDTTPLEYEWDFGDGTKARGNEVNHCFPEPANYTITLNVINKITNEISYNDAVYDLEIPDIIQPKIDCPDTAIQNIPIQFTGDSDKYPELTNVKYFWNFNDGQKAIGKQVSHTFNKQGLYKVKLVIIGKDKQNKFNTHRVFKWVTILPPK